MAPICIRRTLVTVIDDKPANTNLWILWLQIDISCRNTKNTVNALLTRTNFVTLKYVTDGWGTDANGFKLVITSVKDPSKCGRRRVRADPITSQFPISPQSTPARTSPAPPASSASIPISSATASTTAATTPTNQCRICARVSTALPFGKILNLTLINSCNVKNILKTSFFIFK